MGLKLIRDRDHTDKPMSWIRPVQNKTEHQTLLTQKANEELGEYLAARTYGESATEAADLLQIMIDRIVLMHGHHGNLTQERVLTQILAALEAKAMVKGTFSGGTVLDMNEVGRVLYYEKAPV